MNALKKQPEILLERYKSGHLAETDIVSVLRLADDTAHLPCIGKRTL